MASSLNILFLTTLSLLLLLPHLGSSTKVDIKPVLTYHKGPLLGGRINLAILWYGNFGRVHKSTITKFVKSLNHDGGSREPRVSSWWKTIENYQSVLTKRRIPGIKVRVAKATTDRSYSLGKILTQEHITTLVQEATGGSNSLLPVIFTAKDVSVQGFCMGKCSKHGTVGARQLYVMVVNPEHECPDVCAWPFHKSAYGPQTMSLQPPSGNVGADSMVLGFASALAGVVTNPYNSGYFQGPVAAPLEAVSSCQGIFGSGAFPGYTGKVRIDPSTGGCFNAHGVRGQKFLLPAVWNPRTSTCWTLM